MALHSSPCRGRNLYRVAVHLVVVLAVAVTGD